METVAQRQREKIKRLLTLFIAFAPLYAYAQTAAILKVEGDVTVKMPGVANWEKARADMKLAGETRIKTGTGARCVLGFDEGLNKIVAFEGDTVAAITSVEPGEVSLTKGRAFTLIDTMQNTETFNVRTPTAAAGALGTGWLTDSHTGGTDLKCFDNAISVEGLDPSGNPTGEKDLEEGFGLEVADGGIIGDPSRLTEADYAQWNGFVSGVSKKGLEK